MDANWHHRLSLRHLRMIDSLGRLGLVARVAEALSLTQPAISKQLAELERIVGVPIVLRDRNRVFLTPAGERLASHARLVLAQLDRAAFDVNAIAAGISGAISVGVVGSVAPTLMPEVVVSLMTCAPDVKLTFHEGHFISLLPLLNDNSIDFLIARSWQPHEHPGLAQRRLYDEKLVVVAGPDHPLADDPTIDWARAADWPWILPQGNSIAFQAVSAMFASHGLLCPINAIASLSLALNLQILNRMPALALYPQHLATRHAQRKDLVVLPLDTGDTLSQVRCFWRADAPQTSSAALFMDCLLQSSARLFP